GGLLSVALSLGSGRSPRPAGVTRHLRFVEPGLSSIAPKFPWADSAAARPPGGSVPITVHVALQQQLEQQRADLAVQLAVDLARAPAALEGTDRGVAVGNVVAEALERQVEGAWLVVE